MAGTMTSEAQPTPPTASDNPSYAIDLGRFEASGRSSWAVASSRFCRSCQRKYGITGGGESPRAKRQPKAAKETTDPLEVISGCCSKTTGYLDGSLPIAEAMFRILLARGNKPISLAEMQSSLESWGAQAERRRDLSASTVRRILDNASFYHIRRVSSEG